MRRPEYFEDIVGHPHLITYFKKHIEQGTLPHFFILEGPEGLGKTSLADIIALSLVYGLNPSDERKSAYDNLVVKNESNDFIKRFKCSVEGGKDAARLIKDEMHTAFNLHRPKVIICDECHGLTEQAQDVFLAETEFIEDNVYIIMLTTEVTKLKASLRSRAVPIHLNPLKMGDMMTVLKKEVEERKLNLQNEQATLQMIAEWAECKPRTGLNILTAFSNGSTVATDTVRELIGYMDIRDVIILLSTLSGSMTYGLSLISEMTINSSLISSVIECITVMSGQASYKVKLDDAKFMREQLNDVSVEQLVKFLYGLTKTSHLTRSIIVNAYIQAHRSFNFLAESNPVESLAMENIQRANVQMEMEPEIQMKVPTIEDLMLTSDIVEG